MTPATYWLLAGTLVCLTAAAIRGEEPARYFEENGVTYREQRRIENRPVTSTEWESRERTVYRDRVVTEMRESQRIIYTPITEYQVEPRWHNWWNPFGQPYVAYHMKPVTRWEARVQSYQQPTTFREWVPEREVVQVPKRTLRMEEREVIERVAIEQRGPTHRLSARPIMPRRPRPVGWEAFPNSTTIRPATAPFHWT